MTRTLAIATLSKEGKPVTLATHRSDNTLIAQEIDAEGVIFRDIYDMSWEEFFEVSKYGFKWQIIVPFWIEERLLPISGKPVYRVMVGGSGGYSCAMVAEKRKDAELGVEMLTLYRQYSQEDRDNEGMAFHRFNYERGYHPNSHAPFWQSFASIEGPYEPALNDDQFLALVHSECALRNERRLLEQNRRAFKALEQPQERPLASNVTVKAQTRGLPLLRHFLKWLGF